MFMLCFRVLRASRFLGTFLVDPSEALCELDPVAINQDLPQRLAAVILCCLEKSPGRRFGSVMEIASLLEETNPG